jgi:hypothetical protein
MGAMAALLFAHCDSQGTGNTTTPADLTMTSSQDLAAEPDLSGTPDLAVPPDMTPPGPPSEFTVVRIGTGSGALTNDATATFLERRKIADGALVGTPLALPVAVNGANKQLTLSGLATVEGQLSRSQDGRYLIIAGYAANPGVKDVSSSVSTTYNRVVGRIDAAGNINTATASTAFSGAAVRGATSTDGTSIWISSDGGIGYTTLNSTMLPTILNTTNTRAIDVFGTNNGRQLYVSSNSSSGTSNQGINSVGSGVPTTGTPGMTRLSGFTDTNSQAPVGFVAFDRDGTGAVDQMYVADDRNAAGGGVQRWKLNGTMWMLEGTISTGATAGARYVTGYVTGNTAIVLVTTAELTTAQSRVLQLTDTGAATSAVTSKVLATAGTNTTYRGIALAPNP